MKYGNTTFGQIEALLNKIGGEDGLKKILSGTVELTLKTVSYIVATYKVMMNYGRSIKDSVKAGKYDWVNDGITDKNFPQTENDKTDGEKEMALFHFNRYISSEDAIAGMKAEGYRPATMRELLGFGEHNPELQREFPIVALGSVAELFGDRHVGCLDRDDAGRSADLYCFGSVWSGSYRFLAVRN